jgi:hypothetical protein
MISIFGAKGTTQYNPDADVPVEGGQVTTFPHSSLERQRKSNIQMRMGTQRPGKILPS